MSFNKKRLPELEELKKNHNLFGDEYLEQFRSSDALIGPADSGKYLDDYFKSTYFSEHNNIEYILSLLIEAKNILFNRTSSKYFEDYQNLEKVINSITNK